MGSSWEDLRESLRPCHVELEYHDFERWRGRIVYVWTRAEEVLYVGMSIRGLERPLAASHERLRDFAPGDRLTVWRTDSPATLEAALIQQLRPRLNVTSRQCLDCGTAVAIHTPRCWHCKQAYRRSQEAL